MTHFWADGLTVDMRTNHSSVPTALHWQQRWHGVQVIYDCWRIDSNWWRVRIWHDYYIFTTDSGLLLIVYQDLLTGDWFLLRLYD